MVARSRSVLQEQTVEVMEAVVWRRTEAEVLEAEVLEAEVLEAEAIAVVRETEPTGKASFISSSIRPVINLARPIETAPPSGDKRNTDTEHGQS
ncbi:unnamed protein product [Boreogadus saida]